MMPDRDDMGALGTMGGPGGRDVDGVRLTEACRDAVDEASLRDWIVAHFGDETDVAAGSDDDEPIEIEWDGEEFVEVFPYY